MMKQQKQIFLYADDVNLSARGDKCPSVFPKAEAKRYSVYCHREGKKKQNISTFKTLELKNYDFILKSKTLKPTDRWSKQLAVD